MLWPIWGIPVRGFFIQAGCTAGVTVANADDRGPNAWLATPPGTNATATLLKGGLYGWEGDSFGATSSFVRFSTTSTTRPLSLVPSMTHHIAARCPSLGSPCVLSGLSRRAASTAVRCEVVTS